METEEKRETFWRHMRDEMFMLHIDNHKAALLNLQNNRLMLHRSPESEEEEEYILPFTADVFAEAERRLGIARVDDFRKRDVTTPDRVDWRDLVDQRVDIARREYPPRVQAQNSLQEALDHLNAASVDRGLTPKGNQARQAIAAAMEALKKDDDRRSETRRHLQQALDLLPQNVSMASLSTHYGVARSNVETAMACLQYEAQAERALAPDQSNPELAPEILFTATQADDQEAHASLEDRLFEPSRASRGSERERDDARGIDAEDTGREM